MSAIPHPLASYEAILYEVEDPVATITLNRPEQLNAITPRLREELKHAVAEAERDERVVGIVITGAGRGFCAGADAASLRRIEAEGDGSFLQNSSGVPAASPGDASMGPNFVQHYAYLLTVRKPVIAAVNGVVAGVGYSMACFCDLRFVSERARFVPAFSQRGLVAEQGLSWMLPRLVGHARALDLLWSSRPVDGPEALALGLADRLFAPEALLDGTREYIRRLAASVSPSSLKGIKRQIYRALIQSPAEAMDEARQLTTERVTTVDFKEGLASFLERRPPKFPRLTDI